MSARLRRAVGEARDRLHGRLAARRAVAGAALAAIPAAGLAAAAWAGAPAWLAPLAVGAGAAAGAAWGALTRVTMLEAAVALDRASEAGDRVATAWEIAGRKEKGELAARVVADGLAALRPAAFPWTFRRRDALAALAAAALALLAVAAPAEPVRARRDADAVRIVGEERERLARSAAEALAALEKKGVKAGTDAAKEARDLANNLGSDASKSAAELERMKARLQALAASIAPGNPDAARDLRRLADRCAASGDRVARAGGAPGSDLAPPAADAGRGALDNVHALPDTAPPAFSAVAPADPVAFQSASWPAEYDAAVTHYFSEERK